MVGQAAGFGEEILEGRALDVLHFAGAPVARVEVILEERTKIDFFEWIFLFGVGGGRRAFFYRCAVAVLLPAIYIIEQGNGFFQFFENWILYHLGRYHVPDFLLVERQDG